MGDCRIQIRYLGALAVDANDDDAGHNHIASTSASTNSKSTVDAISWVTTPSADTTLRQLADTVLVDLDGRIRAWRRSDDHAHDQQKRLCFGSGIANAITHPSTTSSTSSDSSSSMTKALQIYDITLHPPQSVASTLLSNPNLSGKKSKTLHDMGWYPSAILALCYDDDDVALDMVRRGLGAKGAGEEAGESEYNRPSTSKENEEKGGAMVRLEGINQDGTMGDGYRPKPSEIMASVAARDDSGGNVNGVDGGDASDAAGSKRGSTAAVVARKRREARRAARLDEAIRRIDDAGSSGKNKNKKNAAVSAQVKKMLMKSRATGTPKSMREEDRFYLEIVFVDDTATAAEGDNDNAAPPSYRFFSQMANAGHVTSKSVPRPVGSDATVELLVKVVTVNTPSSSSRGEQQQSATEYRRLPNLMALHEAEEGGYLKQFDRVVVRAYRIATAGNEDEDDGGSSKSVLDKDDGATEETNGQQRQEAVGRPTKQPNEGTSEPEAMEVDDGNTGGDMNLSERISGAIEVAVVASSAKGKKNGTKKQNKSATSEKVRQMLIKSKAKGDKKNVKKDVDRFYVEVVVVEESAATGEMNAAEPPAPYFFNRMAAVGSILGVMGITADDTNVEILARDVKDDKVYHQLDRTIRFCDAEKAAKLQQFSCLVVKRGE